MVWLDEQINELVAAHREVPTGLPSITATRVSNSDRAGTTRGVAAWCLLGRGDQSHQRVVATSTCS